MDLDNRGCEDGLGPGEVEEQGTEGHSWSNTTYPLMMMMRVYAGMTFQLVFGGLQRFPCKNYFL